jgi:hypothetical protein
MEGLPICGSILLENPNSLSAKVLFRSNIIYGYATGCIFLLLSVSVSVSVSVASLPYPALFECY